MEVTYHGESCVRLRGRDVEVAVDPPEGGGAGRSPLRPDIVVRTSGVTDPAALRPAEGRPQVISGPGEYEVRGVSVLGMPVDGVTVMRIEIDEVTVAAVGRLARQLTEAEIDALGHVDVLVVPVGGGDALGALEATRLVNAVEPAVVVPVRHRPPGAADSPYDTVDRFAKEMGLPEGSPAQPRLTLSGSMGGSEDTRVVILEQRRGG